ncbi:MAG: SAM-dependent chlorinase/fluorinase [Pirellulales bacterium]
MSHVVTLTTDFGSSGPYVAAMKGVLLSRSRVAPTIVDIAHDLPPQNVRAAALVFAQAAPWFPAGTLHVAVVDPGVGTSRKIVYAEIDGQRYLAPDNGLLSRVAAEHPSTILRSVENRAVRRCRRPDVSWSRRLRAGRRRDFERTIDRGTGTGFARVDETQMADCASR